MNKPYPPLYYADYLGLDRLLSSQSPKSDAYGKPAHDEMLFIIVHQTYELWFKQILHELDSVLQIFDRQYVDESAIGVAVARLTRVAAIQELLTSQFAILETMTPLDFLDFRDYLLPASGFQSLQFRLLELKLGLRRPPSQAGSSFSRLRPEDQERLDQSGSEPALADLIEKWLERLPFLDFEGFHFLQSYRGAVERMLADDRTAILANPSLSDERRQLQLAEFRQTEEDFAALWDENKHAALVARGQRRLSYRATFAALLINLYRDQPILHLPFRLLTALADIDELMTAWRQRHGQMAGRMIGTKVGTGGSSGHQYLRSTADQKIFADLTNLSTYLIPRSVLPKLPPDIERNLGFFYTRS